MAGFKLNVQHTEREDRPQRDRVEVDWDALNAHIIAEAKTATKARSLPGIISGIIDLGVQNREPFEGPWTEADAAKPGAEEYLEGKVRMIRVPQAPRQQVAITVDFPQIVVDKGQFFGESSPAPLRLLLNSEFGHHGPDGKWVPTLKRGFVVSDVPHEVGGKKHWGIAKTNTLFKLADAADILDENGLFPKERVGDLLGKAVQFTIRVYMKPGKQGKSYFTEEIKPSGMIPDGVAVPVIDPSYLYGINFTAPNEPAALKQLRKSIKNTIKMSTTYEGSVIQTELEALSPPRGVEASYTGRAAGGATTPPATPSVAPTARPVTSLGDVSAPKSTLVPLPEAKGGTWEDDEAELIPF